MRPFGALARLTICATLLCAVGSAGVAMDLREMPPWLRAMIEPVHLGPAAEVETVQVGAAGALAPAVGIGAGAVHAPGMGGPTGPAPVGISAAGAATVDIGAGPATVGVSAPGAGPISVGGGVSLEAWGTPGAGAVHAPGIGGATGPAPVRISAAAQDWSEAVGSIEGLDRETLAQAGQILAMIRERGVSAEEFSEWTAEHRPAPEVLSAAVAMVGFHRHDNYPTPQPEALAIASGLAILAGDDLSEVDAIPPFGRLWLAILFSKRGDDQRAETSFTSMTDEELVRLPRETAVMTVAHLIFDAPIAAVSAIQRYADVVDDHMIWSLDLFAACRRAASTDLCRRTFIPIAEDTLGETQSHAYWGTLLDRLILAYRWIGDTEAAIVRGRHWIAEGRARHVPAEDLIEPSHELALVYRASGDLLRAVEVLRQALDGVPLRADHAATAQAELANLTRMLPGILPAMLMPGRLDRVAPESMSLTLRSGEVISSRVEIRGSDDLVVQRCASTPDFIQAAVRRAGNPGRLEVTISLGPLLTCGRLSSALKLETNDPDTPTVEVPLEIEVTPPVQVSPPDIFLGLIPPKATQGMDIVLDAGNLPFRVISISVEANPHEFTFQRTPRGEERTALHTVAATFTAPDHHCVATGVIVIRTDLAQQPVISVPYYAQVTD